MAGWLSRLFSRPRLEEPDSDPFEAAGDRPTVAADALDGLLAEIEQAALSIYARHGLPTKHVDARPAIRIAADDSPEEGRAV